MRYNNGMKSQAILEYVEKYKVRVDLGIANELERRLKEVKEISPHLVPVLQAVKELSVGGKRLRAMLVILGWQIGMQHTAYSKQQEQEIIKAGVVMEIFHLGLLIQDDFMDRDTLRRGVPTLIARYDDRHVGDFVSMLAGDYTFGWGMEILSTVNLPTTNVNKAIRVWGKYFTRVGYGQTLDGLNIADGATILKILAIKSGEYSCVLPLQLGATLGGADPELLDNLSKYGMELGWVFQLRDDWLGEYGDPQKTGKPVGNDTREGKRTFATMNGMEKTEQTIAEHMTRAAEIVEQGLQGQILQRQILLELVTWMGTREN